MRNKIIDCWRNNKFTIWIIIVALILLILPLYPCWDEQVDFDIVKITEEYYKTIVIYIGISLLVIFISGKNHELRKKRLLNERKSIVRKIKENETNYEIVISHINSFLQKTKDIELLFNNECLSTNEKFAKDEMDYYVSHSNTDNYNEYESVLNNIRTKL